MRICLVFAFLLLFRPALSRGDEMLRQVQEELRKRKVYFGDIDGRATPEIRAALSHYQRSRGLSVTGKISEETLDTLDIAVPVGEFGFPEGVVLRSDPGPGPALRSLPEATPVAASAPTPGQAAVSENEVTAFLKQYLADSKSDALDAEIGHYAPQVNYFDHGEKPLDFIREDVARYRERWPEREYDLLGRVEFQPAEEGVVEAVFTVAFEVRGPRKPARGKTEERFTIDTRGKQWLITGMKERRIRD